MIELKDHSVSDLLIRTVVMHPAVPPVIDVQYVNDQRQYADSVKLVFEKPDSGPWELQAAVVTGDRCLKDGKRGTETKISRLPRYTANKWPDWLVEIINFFTPEG